jgi:hypothetical protein
MGGYAKSCPGGSLFGEFFQVHQLRIDNFIAFQADNMRVWVGLITIKTAAFREADFQNLLNFLNQGNGLVNGGQASGGEGFFYLFVGSLHAGMILAGRQNLFAIAAHQPAVRSFGAASRCSLYSGGPDAIVKRS